MATLFKTQRGSWVVQFEDRDRRRRTLSLGKIPKRAAQQTMIYVEKLAAAQIASTAPDGETSRWLAAAAEKLVGKLSRVGLIETRQSATLGPFIDSFLAARKADPAIKASTIRVSGATYKSLRAYFGETRPLRTITKGDAKAWRVAISKGRAENTIRKWSGIAKLLFNAAIDHELIEANPFGKLKSGTIEVRTRDYFVTVEEAHKVLDACPSMDWRLIFALARFGGLRCPSEVLGLRWNDILWDKERFIVRSVKTEHHEGHETRVVPLFPELVPLLREAHEAAEEGSVYVVGKTRDTACNLRTQMTRIVEWAGIKPWPKIFQNLRATRSTELADTFPGHVAAAWLGHSVKVAKNHYWQVTDEHFNTAKSAANALQTVSERARQGETEKQETPEIVECDAQCPTTSHPQMGDIGFEPTTSAV